MLNKFTCFFDKPVVKLIEKLLGEVKIFLQSPENEVLMQEVEELINQILKNVETGVLENFIKNKKENTKSPSAHIKGLILCHLIDKFSSNDHSQDLSLYLRMALSKGDAQFENKRTALAESAGAIANYGTFIH